MLMSTQESFINDVTKFNSFIFSAVIDLDTSQECLTLKREILTDLSRINLSLKCDLLSGLESKSERQCLKEESRAIDMFQDDQVSISSTFYEQLFLCQKITKPKHNYRKDAQFAFARKTRA